MIRAIAENGQIIDYVIANTYAYDPVDNMIVLHSQTECVAVVPGSWIVKEIPSTELDPGVEARG